ASIMRERKFELSATLVLEVGKNWIEADADVAEGIDFLEFYSREMLRYSDEQPLTKISGEKNEFLYIPLGVVAVISPWNFPLAIMAGMTSAAIIAGNSVVLKPSSDAPLCAYKFLEILKEAGLPSGVVNFLTGSGEEIGDFLSAHPKVRMLAFTGSKEVGLRINERASEIS
ncbi:MAG: aldehyde dehydrogenase family protein, partial [Armatimonadetes bacterium]|nr:aldehyde dehydrogenase family protein [Armatimonadota bacterium]